MISREVVQGRQLQGENEQIAYKITTTPWAPTPASPVIVVKDVQNSYADVTGTTTSGSATISGDVITLPIIQNLIAGKLYRVELQFTANNNVFEPYFYILAER